MNFLHTLYAQISVNRNDLGLPDISPKANTQNILDMVFGIAGTLTILLVAYGGFKYVLSQGDPGATAKAKDTIMYALIGMVLTVFAFGIVSFVMGRV